MGLGAVLPTFITRRGIGLDYDSVMYISAARNLRAGKGLQEINIRGGIGPLVWFPPLYPVTLAGGGVLGVDPMRFAVVVDSIFFAALAGLAAWMAARQRKGVLAAVLVGGCLLSSQAMLHVYSMAWSETMFNFFALAALALIGIYARRGGLRWLIACGVCVGAAWLTRYVGVMLVGVVLGVLAISKASSGRKVRDGLVVLAVAGAMVGPWLARNWRLGHGLTGRRLGFHPVTMAVLWEGARTLLAWKIVWVALGMLMLWGVKRVQGSGFRVQEEKRSKNTGTNEETQWEAGLWIFLIAYPFMVLVSICFMDAATPLDDRILSPMLAPLIILVVVRVCRSGAVRWVRQVGVAAVIVVVVVNAVGSVRWAGRVRKAGQQLASREWTDRPVMDYVRALPADAAIYTNETALLYIHTGRLTASIPSKGHLPTGVVFDDYSKRLAVMGADLRRRHGVVIYFNEQKRLFPSRAELESAVGLEKIVTLGPDVVYRVKE